MPEVSRFFGVVIRMYFSDHGPPHFHAEYSGEEAKIQIDPLEVMTGYIPPRVLALVLEWATLHQDELLGNWRRLREKASALPIQPLE